MSARRKTITPSKFSTKVGTFALGSENVDLYLTPQHGGEFSVAPADGTKGFINVGHYDGRADLSRVLHVLMHEALEYVMARQGWRFLPSPCNSISHAAYLFTMTHEQFDEAVGSAGNFIGEAMPEIQNLLAILKKSVDTGKPIRLVKKR